MIGGTSSSLLMGRLSFFKVAKNVGSPRRTPLATCMADNCLGCVLSSLMVPGMAGTMQGLPFSKMQSELKQGIGIAITLRKKSMPSTTLKSSIGATEKSTWPFQVPKCSSASRATPLSGCALALTALSQPSRLVHRRPTLLASSSVMKLWVAPVSTITFVGVSLMRASTYISPLLDVAGIGLAFKALRSWSDPMCPSSSFVSCSASCCKSADNDPILGH
ncbi:hypothetical protein ABFS83_03G057000 [Erythranthe nasuta]